MISLDFFQWFEIVASVLIMWVGIYLISRNPLSKLLWVITLYLISIGCTLLSDPILRNTNSFSSYLVWQKMTDWTVLFLPVFFLHASLLISKSKKTWLTIMLFAGYAVAFIAMILDQTGSGILNSKIIRFDNYQRFDGFAPGPFLVPIMIFLFILTLVGNYFWYKNIDKPSIKKMMPLIGGLVLSLMILFGTISFYIKIQTADIILSISLAISAFIFIYSILRFYIFSPNEKVLLNKSFYMKSLSILIILIIYLLLIDLSLPQKTFETFLLSCFIIILVMITHSFYDWFSTFLNDLAYNFSSGLSVVTDEEAWYLIKNYNSPQKLEENSLVRLNIVKKKIKNGELAIDSLRHILEEAIDYFRPNENETKRIKRNLKYHIIRMIAFDEAEEGQILWNLGFDEYPVRIMSQAGSQIAPQFKTQTPSDYSFTSRNAYLALKKEAVHDIAWRISYLEKHALK